jgi:probable HAF family extracellular repeat protein
MTKYISQLWLAGAVMSINLALYWLGLAPDRAQAAESPYVFNKADIPTRNGQLGFASFADVSDTGRILGGFTDTVAAPYGFVLNDNFKANEIRCSKDVVATVPQSINKRGEIAGFATVIVDRVPIPDPPYEMLVTKVSGFFRNKAGKCKILDFPGADLTEARGLNDAGQVVGDYRDAAGTFRAFVWDDGSFVSFDVPFAGAHGSSLSQINNRGQSIGFYWDDNGTYDFIYDNGAFTFLPHVPTAQFSEATDINDQGQIVGNYADNSGAVHGFVLEDGVFTTIDVPVEDVAHTIVSGINNRGQVVGRYLTSNPDDPSNPFPSHGFIATPSEHLKLIARLEKRLGEMP